MKIITLPHIHHHNGIEYKAGEQIELSDAEYTWLIQATLSMRQGQRIEAVEVIGSPEWADDVITKASARENKGKEDKE